MKDNVVLFILLLALVLTACHSPKAPSQTDPAFAEVTLIPTETEKPPTTPTETPKPASSPTPSPTPVLISRNNWQELDVVQVIGDGDLLNVEYSVEEGLIAI